MGSYTFGHQIAHFHYIIIIALHMTYLGDFPYHVRVRLYLALYEDYITLYMYVLHPTYTRKSTIMLRVYYQL